MKPRNSNFVIKEFFSASFVMLIILTGLYRDTNSAIKNITVQDFVFTPSNVVAEVGDTIKWIWLGPRGHTTTCDGILPGTSLPAGAASWDVELNSGNPAYQYILAVSGVYDYVCTFHSPGMSGEIIANAPLPVELTDFVATTIKNEVILDWSTTGELNNDRFEIQRIEISKLKGFNDNDDYPYFTIGILRGQGTSSQGHHYKYTDRNLNTGIYSYRLKQVDFNSNFIYHYLSEDIVIGIPSKFNISQNYPNPFNPSTKINYELPFEGFVRISLFNINGKEVSNLISEYQPAGYRTIEVNGSNLSSGVYFYTINYTSTPKSVSVTKRMLLVK
ncbi:MAG: T9SS type A sorting domain-containing protein [Bacteroidota bacterium]|nr:T9SS type A sorting domain-containing protein [Bacteroidota bacterium]